MARPRTTDDGYTKAPASMLFVVLIGLAVTLVAGIPFALLLGAEYLMALFR